MSGVLAHRQERGGYAMSANPYPGICGAIQETAVLAKTLKLESDEACELQRALSDARLREWKAKQAAANNVIQFRPRVRE